MRPRSMTVGLTRPHWSKGTASALDASKRYTSRMARPKDPQETRRRLLAAADEVFYAHGIRNSSVDDVAQRAGLTKRTLYYHFPSKDDPPRRTARPPWPRTA